MKTMKHLIIGAIAACVALTTSVAVHAQIPNLLTNGDYVYKLTGSNVLVYADGQTESTANKAADIFATVASVTNFIAEVGGGAALSGKPTYVAEAGVIYNVAPNSGVTAGPLIAYKYMKMTGSSPATADVLKGGGSFGIPFTNHWTGPIVWTPNAQVAICTPTRGTSNDGGVGLDNSMGVAATFYNNKSIAFDVSFDFVNSTGQGAYDRNYGIVALALKCGF